MADAPLEPRAGSDKMLRWALLVLAVVMGLVIVMIPMIAASRAWLTWRDRELHRLAAVERFPPLPPEPVPQAPVVPNVPQPEPPPPQPQPAPQVEPAPTPQTAQTPPSPSVPEPIAIEQPKAWQPPPPTPSIIVSPQPSVTRRRLGSRGLFGGYQPETLSDRDVTEALNRGADALLRMVNDEVANMRNPGVAANRSRFTRQDENRQGEIAISVYALLTVGRITGDPRLRFTSKEMTEPVNYLLNLEPTSTYTLSLQASALSMLPNRPDLRRPLIRARDRLIRGTSGGPYTYGTERPASSGDNSNTQYGQLGVWACQDAGIEVPQSYWNNIDRYWRGTQSAAGGWGYPTGAPSSLRRPGGGETFTMTCAGVASLFLAKEDIDRSVALEPRPDRNLDSAIQWLSEKFTARECNNLYAAYGIERVALSGGIKNLGDHDWFREGASEVLNNQRGDIWRYSSDLVGTSYALLFLSRGIAPIAVGKLQYDGPWNARSRDCARFVHWLDKKTERTLNWQVLPVNSNPDDWRTPVLVITGHGDPNFSPEQITNLRRYVLRGGLIFSSSDGNDAAFTRAIRYKYAPAIFGNRYEMRALPPDHYAFNIEYKISPTVLPRLVGLSNGIRDVWIHSEDDIGAAWQAYAFSRGPHFEMPANLYFYATGRSSARLHLDPLTKPTVGAPSRTFNIARIVYIGNDDPEPAAWDHFAGEMLLHHGVGIRTVQTVISDLDAAKTPIAYITGTTAFTFSDDQIRKLREFVANGGVIFADSAGGNDAFTHSFKTAVTAIFPDNPMQDVFPDCPVITGSIPGGEAIKDLDRRHFAMFPDTRTRPLNFMEVTLNHRPVVLFSHGDLTAGIGGIRTWGILGHTPEVASSLTWNALLYLTTPPNPDLAPHVAASQPAPAVAQ